MSTPSTALARASENNKVGMPTSRLAYRRWLLYVLPDCPACIDAMRLAVQVETDVQISNLQNIPKSKRPPWLVGVPTLVDLAHNRTFAGSAVMEALDKYVQSEPLPAGTVNTKFFQLGAAGDTENEWGAPALAHDFIMPDLSHDPRYDSSAPITRDHIAALMEARGVAAETKTIGYRDSSSPQVPRLLPRYID